VVKDVFQKALLTAHAGEKYLVIRYNDVVATLAYLTPAGPISFDVDAGAELTFPFTASCAPNPPHSYFAVFADVSVFAEPQLVTKICDLKNGATVTLDGAKQAGYANAPGAGTSFLYEIFLNAFSAQCGGAENGHIRVRSINALGTAQTLVPFEVIAAEK
jgi:hypothetical protein